MTKYYQKQDKLMIKKVQKQVSYGERCQINKNKTGELNMFEPNADYKIFPTNSLDDMINTTKEPNILVNFKEKVHKKKKKQLKEVESPESATLPKFNPFRNAHDKKKFEPLFLKRINADSNTFIENETDQNEFENPLTILRLNNSPVEEIKTHQEFVFGNYGKYYNYRYEKKWQDPRIKFLTKEYFFNKKCLDIGCNDGTLTIMIAIKYYPIQIIGIDIDYRLINKAINNLQFFEKQHNFSQNSHNEDRDGNEIKYNTQSFNNNNKTNLITYTISSNDKTSYISNKLDEKNIDGLMEKLKSFPKSFMLNMGIPKNLIQNDIKKNLVLNSEILENVEITTQVKKGDFEVSQNKDKFENNIHKELGIKNQFPNNIDFRIQNFIKDMSANEKFDTILCLSITKWIHLNWGDCGIRRLFKKIHSSLNLGGILILEPQEWRSYQKRKYICDDFKNNFKTI